MKKSDFTFVKIEDIQKIPEKGGFYELVKNRWWAVTENDEVLFYKGSKQCNPDKTISEHLLKTIKDYPADRVVFIENAFCSHDCNDYLY